MCGGLVDVVGCGNMDAIDFDIAVCQDHDIVQAANSSQLYILCFFWRNFDYNIRCSDSIMFSVNDVL